jgi:hypothetical protein
MRGQVERDRDDTCCDGTERSGAPRPPVDGSQWLLRVRRIVTTTAVVRVPVSTRNVVASRLRVSVRVERGIGTGHQ